MAWFDRNHWHQRSEIPTLLDILEERYGNSSVIITSQLPIESWYNFIDAPTLADAIMDGLKASAHRLSL